MKLPFALLSLSLLLGPTTAAHAQSTGMGVVMKDPTPRDPDPRDLLKPDQPSLKNPKQLKVPPSAHQLVLLGECNQVLLLAHQLHLKALYPSHPDVTLSNREMTTKIAELAKKIQKEQQPTAAAAAEVPLPPAATRAPAEEQALILADTQRLFQLAAELKLQLVNGSPDTFSLGVQKRAAEIEALARSLHQRIKN
jgi:hypothetical protein